ncbi:hypothetical protein SNE40_020373 [Patella caerulea]|uniref:Fibrinogen C-terminal domain-containing protein n=1 Tax=Patella caerulea TaxID=87958 RepID=A0AAN8J182_PATCE
MADHSILLLLIFEFLFCFVISENLESKYIKTKVLTEGMFCLTDDFLRILDEETAYSIIDCARFCSSNADCRKFMFDKETKLCSLTESGENCITDENVDNKVCFRQKSVCNEVNCIRCPFGYYGDQCQHIIQDCSHGSQLSLFPVRRLMSFIRPSQNDRILEVKCDFEHSVMMIQYRRFGCQELDFNRTMDEYAGGFGYPHGNYWLGLDHLYNILQNSRQFKFVVFVTFPSSSLFGWYMDFNISSRLDNYRISINSYWPDPNYSIGDSLTNATFNIDGRPFSTYDNDSSNHNCPDRFKGGWWFLDDPVCSRANVNGRRFDNNFEATWHWLDNLGNRTFFYDVQLRLKW